MNYPSITALKTAHKVIDLQIEALKYELNTRTILGQIDPEESNALSITIFDLRQSSDWLKEQVSFLKGETKECEAEEQHD